MNAELTKSKREYIASLINENFYGGVYNEGKEALYRAIEYFENYTERTSNPKEHLKHVGYLRKAYSLYTSLIVDEPKVNVYRKFSKAISYFKFKLKYVGYAKIFKKNVERLEFAIQVFKNIPHHTATQSIIEYLSFLVLENRKNKSNIIMLKLELVSASATLESAIKGIANDELSARILKKKYSKNDKLEKEYMAMFKHNYSALFNNILQEITNKNIKKIK